jgi:hypothetical protein
VRVPKMVRGKCALHEKRVRIQFFSCGEAAYLADQQGTIICAVEGGAATVT